MPYDKSFIFGKLAINLHFARHKTIEKIVMYCKALVKKQLLKKWDKKSNPILKYQLIMIFSLATIFETTKIPIA